MHDEQILREGGFEYEHPDIIKLMRSIGYVIDFVDGFNNYFFGLPLPKTRVNQSTSP